MSSIYPPPVIPFLALILLGTARTMSSQTVPLPATPPGQSIAPGTNLSNNQPLTPGTPDALLRGSWWNGGGATGTCFGLRSAAQDYGLMVSGESKQNFSSMLSGGLPNSPANNYASEVKIKVLLDLEKLFGIEGFTVESSWRDREGQNPRWAASTPRIFSPYTTDNSPGVRILSQQIQYVNGNGSFLINAGWENPYEQFLQQPLSKFFENQAIASSKGIGAVAGPGVPAWSQHLGKYGLYQNSPIPWGSTYQAWGGTLKVKPSSATYVMSGLYLAISNAGGGTPPQFSATAVYPYTPVARSYLGQFRQSYQTVRTVNASGIPNGTKQLPYAAPVIKNNGFNFSGSATFDPSALTGPYTRNGLYNLNEIGWTPKFGSGQLEGKYALGGYLWGQENCSYAPIKVTSNGGTQYVQNSLLWGLYLQADQMLYRAKDDQFVSTGTTDLGGKNPAAPTARTKKILSKKGLSMFSEFTFTPPQNNAMPFYGQVGLVYRGLIPHRDNDSTGIALGAGFYSADYNQFIRELNRTTTAVGSPYQPLPGFTSTEVIEAFHNIQLNSWCTLKPFAQYIINPAGDGAVGNDFILGLTAKVLF